MAILGALARNEIGFDADSPTQVLTAMIFMPLSPILAAVLQRLAILSRAKAAKIADAKLAILASSLLLTTDAGRLAALYSRNAASGCYPQTGLGQIGRRAKSASKQRPGRLD